MVETLSEAAVGPGPFGPEDLGRELQALVSRRIAHLGWDVRTELVLARGEAHLDCFPASDNPPLHRPHRLRFPLETLPLPLQAERVIESLRRAGWLPAGDSTPAKGPTPSAGMWCSPEP